MASFERRDVVRYVMDKMIEWHIADSRELDNLIYLLASGALGLTMNQFFGNQLIFNWLLVAGWIFLVCTLVLHTLAYIFSLSQKKDVMDRCAKWLLENRDEFSSYGFESNSKYDSYVSMSNAGSRIFLLVGLTLITIFISINHFKKQKIMDTKDLSKTEATSTGPLTTSPFEAYLGSTVSSSEPSSAQQGSPSSSGGALLNK